MVGSNLDKSTNTGFKLAFMTEKAVEQYVIAGIITSELFGKFKDFNAIVSASVPFAQLTAYFTPQNLEKFFSNLDTDFPKMKSPCLNSLAIS